MKQAWKWLSNEYVLISGIVIIGIIANFWVLNPQNWFIFDDFSFLYNLQFKSIGDLIFFFPRAAYNDRPIGVLIIKIMYDVFGMNPQLYHVVLLLLHIGNALLIFSIVKKFLIYLQSTKYSFIPFISAIIFVVWPKSTMPVQWISAIFDLFGGTLFLLIIHLYISNKISATYKIFNTFLMILFFYTALRTKEMIIVLPVLLFVFEICFALQGKLLQFKNIKQITISSIVKILGGIMVLYAMGIMYLKTSNPILNDPAGPYYFTFSPNVIFINIIKYLSMYFDYFRSDMGFVKFNWIVTIPVVLFASGSFFYAIYQSVKYKKYWWIGMIISMGIIMAPVLPMKNMQHILYLYIPSMLFSVFLACVIKFMLLRISSIKFRSIIVMLLVCGTFSLIFTKQGFGEFRPWWEEICTNNKTSYYDLKKIPPPQKNSVIYITNVKDNYNIFYYGPGFINNIVFNDISLKTIINPALIDKSKKYLILDYQNKTGYIKEIERSS